MKTTSLAIIAALLMGLSAAAVRADDEPAAQVPPAAPVTPEKKPANPPERPPATTPEKNPQSPTDKPVPSRPKPANSPVAPDSTPATKPSDSDKGEQASAKSGDSDFPTPAELIKRLQKQKAAKASLSKVVHFDLATSVAEKPADFSVFGTDVQMTLRSIIQRMQMARDDKDVRAVLLTLGEPSLNFAQAQEVRDALLELRKAGKKTFVYSDSYDTVTYTLATGATDVCLMEGGEIMIPGVGMEAKPV